MDTVERGAIPLKNAEGHNAIITPESRVEAENGNSANIHVELTLTCKGRDIETDVEASKSTIRPHSFFSVEN
jgi:hypothetical protein